MTNFIIYSFEILEMNWPHKWSYILVSLKINVSNCDSWVILSRIDRYTLFCQQ